MQAETTHLQRWNSHLQDCGELLKLTESLEISGRVTLLTGLVMEAIGIKLPVGSACTIPLPDGRKIEAEVVGFDGDRLLLMPQSSIEGIVPGTRVFPLEVTEHIPKPGSADHP